MKSIFQNLLRSQAKSYATRLQVLRTVDTTGWISADFHVHSKPSMTLGYLITNALRRWHVKVWNILHPRITIYF